MIDSQDSKICIKCGNWINKEAKFCEKCGAFQEFVNKCNKCGREMSIDSNFCPSCGERMSPGTQNYSNDEESELFFGIFFRHLAFWGAILLILTGFILPKPPFILGFIGIAIVLLSWAQPYIKHFWAHLFFFTGMGLLLIGLIHRVLFIPAVLFIVIGAIWRLADYQNSKKNKDNN